ncbi:MAG: Hint domain-containing protein [Acidisphaera sp.]|nr:Hint domain-containing protein [Acidisphaera sp.]
MAFAYSVLLNDPQDLGGSDDSGLVTDLKAALADWSQYITGLGTLVVQLDFSSGSGGELASGGATVDIGDGQTLDGRELLTPSSIYELDNGAHVPGYTSDITVTVFTGSLSSLYINPDPGDGAAVPSNEYDATSIFRHELAHGFGFGGATDPMGQIGTYETLWDHYLEEEPNGSAFFVGPDAEAAYGGPVPITTLPNGEGYAHVGNSANGPLGQDLMNGVGFAPGRTYDISAVDVAMLEDVGVPTDGAVPCFCAGTRILTPGGEVAVEELRPGDRVTTVSGAAAEVIWVGSRRVDLRRHARPERVAPVCIRAGVFAAGVPRRDLRLSPDHAVHAEGVLIPAGRLVDGIGVVQEHPPAVRYVHIELARHDVLLAEGLPAESFRDTGNRAQFAMALHPDFAAAGEAAFAPLCMMGQSVARLRRRLRARALYLRSRGSATGGVRGNAPRLLASAD